MVWNSLFLKKYADYCKKFIENLFGIFEYPHYIKPNNQLNQWEWTAVGSVMVLVKILLHDEYWWRHLLPGSMVCVEVYDGIHCSKEIKLLHDATSCC